MSRSEQETDLLESSSRLGEATQTQGPQFYAHPRPAALEALSLRHNPAVISSPHVTDQTTHEPITSSAKDGSRTHSDQLPWQSSAPHLSDQNSIAAEASAHQQPRQLSQTPDYSRATRQDDQEARPEPITTDAERMFQTQAHQTIPSAMVLSTANGLTPTISSLASGRNGLPANQWLVLSNVQQLRH